MDDTRQCMLLTLIGILIGVFAHFVLFSFSCWVFLVEGPHGLHGLDGVIPFISGEWDRMNREPHPTF